MVIIAPSRHVKPTVGETTRPPEPLPTRFSGCRGSLACQQLLVTTGL